MFVFNIKYFVATVLLFIIEVLIAMYVQDAFVRPYVGDFLVVILMYCFIKSFLKLSALSVAGFVLLFSFTIECLQYLHFVERLGLGQFKLVKIILGSSFAWMDLVAYLAGIIVVIIIEKIAEKRVV